MRRIDFEGCFNFRDLGGWRTHDGRTVVWKKLYRADSVHLMTPEDADRARTDLGLRTLLDLRHEMEIAFGGAGLLADNGMHRLHLSLRSRDAAVIDSSANAAPSADRSPDTMVAQYLGILDVSSDMIVAAVDAIATADALPAVFFCAAGKDRTGVLSAVILGALGVVDEDIVTDYVLTAETIDEVIGRFAANPRGPAMYRDNPPSHFAPHAETMERVLAHVAETYGSFADYLLAKGLGPDALTTLRGELLEP